VVKATGPNPCAIARHEKTKGTHSLLLKQLSNRENRDNESVGAVAGINTVPLDFQELRRILLINHVPLDYVESAIGYHRRQKIRAHE
jgi:hypothetical protein